jgi:hypothetical protein
MMDSSATSPAAATPATATVSTDSSSAPVALSIGVDADSSRLVQPGAPTIARYQLFGTRQGGSQASLGSWTSLVGATVSVQVGSWDFLLDAYDGTGTLVLEGSLASQSVTAASTLTFHLLPLQSGSGSVSVTLLWPASSGVALVETSFNGQTVTPALSPSAGPASSQTVTYAASSVASGNYLLVFYLKDGAGKTLGAHTEWVLVRKDLASSKSISLEASDINGKPVASGEIGILEGDLTWTSEAVTFAWSDTADNETGYRVETSDDDGTTAATLPAGSTGYPDTIPRGVFRGYRVIAVNSFGESAPMDTWHEAPALFACTGEDAAIATVVVNLWDPTTLEFHGTATLTKYGKYFGGGVEPTAKGTQLVQAYAYDADGKIRAVSEATKTISSVSDSVALTAQSARLMGGNVQKTGGPATKDLAPILATKMNSDYTCILGAVCDGLNLYISDAKNQCITRRVISSGIVARFAGNGTGADEDNPGSSPNFRFSLLNSGGIATDGRQLYFGGENDDGESGWNEISRITLTASSKVIHKFLYPSLYLVPAFLTVEGEYLYATSMHAYRMNLKTYQVQSLNPDTGSWSDTAPTGANVLGGITSDGVRLYWKTFTSGMANCTLCSIPLAGGAVLQHAEYEGNVEAVITDGTSLFYSLYVPEEANPDVSDFCLQIMTIATGEKTPPVLAGNRASCALTTDGTSIFYFPELVP